MTIEKLVTTLKLPEGVLTPSRHNLDREFEAHPEHISKVAEALAGFRLELKTSEASRDRVVGRVTREKLDVEGKVTVKELDALLAQDSECRKAEREVMDAAFEVEVCAGLLSALQAKTSALKHLSELYQAGYYTTTSSRPAPARRSSRDE